MRVIAVAALIVLTAACSAHKNADTVQSGGDNVTVSNSSADSSKLGVPVYPGATQTAGGVSYAGGSGQATALVTSDSFDKVYDWYKGKLPAGSERMKASNGDSSVAEFVVAASDQGGDQTTVSISAKGNQTAIVLTKGIVR